MSSRRTNFLRAGAVALALLVGGVSAAMAISTPSRPNIIKTGAVYRVELGTRSYTFDAARRREVAWTRKDHTAFWKPVDISRAPWADSMRARLLEKLGLTSLDGIPAENQTELKLLRELGYL